MRQPESPKADHLLVLATAVGALTAAIIVVVAGRAYGMEDAKIAIGAMTAICAVILACYAIFDRE